LVIGDRFPTIVIPAKGAKRPRAGTHWPQDRGARPVLDWCWRAPTTDEDVANRSTMRAGPRSTISGPMGPG